MLKPALPEDIPQKQKQSIEAQQADIADAILISIEDVQVAYELAKQGKSKREIVAEISSQGVYDAETLLPQSVDPAQDYEKESIEDLFADSEFQVGARIFAAEKADIILDNVPEEHRQIVKVHVTDPLKNGDPTEILREIIHWTPNTGGGYWGRNSDDNAIDYMKKVMSISGDLCSLTDKQREKLEKDIRSMTPVEAVYMPARGLKMIKEVPIINKLNRAKDCKR